ncbi:hypothetical protein [Myroides sp. TSA_177.3]|uniref:hypothetical protein n=1 Tax=Myroides sp. TSA_177.3 TaxID=3415650 RepID=UPI004045DC38
MVAGFYYWKSDAWTPLLSGHTYIDRKNNSFTIGGNPNKNGEESLIITDTENHNVYLSVTEIANNKTFVETIAVNQDFITKLGDNVDFINHITENNEFIKNIIEELKGTYGNVGYDTVNHNFFYYDGDDEVVIEWDDLGNTKIKSFVVTADFLTITDTDDNVFEVAISDLGKIIANNDVFVTELTQNSEFITKLGDNVDFINHITENNEFIKNIIEELKGTYGNVGYDTVNHNFFYYDGDDEVVIEWDNLGNTKIKSFVVTADFLTITDTDDNVFEVAINDLGKIIANNDVFVTELTQNSEFITKLGDNVDFINHITENNEFIKNIIEELKGTYGNVGYDTVNHNFFYYDGDDEVVIEWDNLGNTKIKSFVVTADFLTITDTDDNVFEVAISDLGKIIANNDVFVTELTQNSEFITKLGDNVDFINQITENNEFIKNIIEELKGTYGNVGYDTVNHNFFYYDGDDEVVIEWDNLGNTKIKSFVVTADFLTITDTDDNVFEVAISDLGKIIANNDVFVTELTQNSEFITKLGDNVDFINQITENNEFIKNIIEELKGTYGNVGYDTVNHNFFYYDGDDKVVIEWDDLGNTKIATFEIDEVKDVLIITDTEGASFSVAISDLGKIIANNDVFVTELTQNSEFITKLGDNIDFINQITENNEFIKNIIEELKGTYGNVGYDTVNHNFFYYDGDDEVVIEWDNLGNTKIATFEIDEVNDVLIITDTEGASFPVAISDLGKIIANNDVFVTELTQNSEFITKLGDNNEFKEMIQDNSIVASLTLNNAAPGEAKAGFVFNNGKDATNVEFTETLTTLKYERRVAQENGEAVSKDFLIYTAEDEKEQVIDIATLVDSNETLTSLLNKVEAGVNVPAVYIYTDENKRAWEINIPEELKQSSVFTDYIDSFIANIPSTVVNYSTTETIKPEKWLGTDKEIAQRVFDIQLNEKTNEIEVPGDFSSVILQARLINKTTNSITEGVIKKTVENGSTRIILGIAGTLSVQHPVGEYYLILEYVKK